MPDMPRPASSRFLLLAALTATAPGCVIQRVTTPAPPNAAMLGDTVDAGTPVTVVSIHPEDAYKPLEKQLRGRACVASDLLTRQRTATGTFYAGSVNCDADGYYFYKVQLSRREGGTPSLSAAVLAPADGVAPWPTHAPKVDPSWLETAKAIDSPAIVQIVAIHADDAYKSDEAAHVGRLCRVINTLNNNGNGYFGGAVICQDGEDFYYYKARVRILVHR